MSTDCPRDTLVSLFHKFRNSLFKQKLVFDLYVPYYSMKWETQNLGLISKHQIGMSCDCPKKKKRSHCLTQHFSMVLDHIIERTKQ
jgi:hypothetical protein